MISSDIEHTLNNDLILEDCIICLEPIDTTTNIWICPQCKKKFHEKCQQNWSQTFPGQNFSCPHCNYIVIINDNDNDNDNNNDNGNIIYPHTEIIYNPCCNKLQNIFILFGCVGITIGIILFIYNIIDEKSYYRYPYNYTTNF